MAIDFITGLRLNELFYHEAVAPILRREFPNLRHAAARMGNGSEVLGYDDHTSTDHDWGPRFQLFLSDGEFIERKTAVYTALSHQLPHSFRGFPTNFAPQNDEGTRILNKTESGHVNHAVEITTLPRFLADYLPYDPACEPTVTDWLAWPQQKLLGVTKGQVYADGLGILQPVRQKLAYYPHDVWLYLLACQWTRIGQEEHFMGRTGSVGDELGSRLLAGRLVHDLMLLFFLMERQYAPYPKWFGTAFAELDAATTLTPLFHEALSATTWQKRERPLIQAYELAAERHNQLSITPTLDVKARYFHERPFLVSDAGRFTTAIRAAITDETIRAIKTDVGAIDQFSDNTDMRENIAFHRPLQAIYR